jgi:hypothetical protein
LLWYRSKSSHDDLIWVVIESYPHQKWYGLAAPVTPSKLLRAMFYYLCRLPPFFAASAGVQETAILKITVEPNVPSEVRKEYVEERHYRTPAYTCSR